MNVFLQHDLLGRMLETYRGQQAPVGLGPRRRPAVDAVMTQQKVLQTLPRRGEPHCCRSRPHQTADGFVLGSNRIFDVASCMLPLNCQPDSKGRKNCNA
jgi:hypothetical protein